MPTHGSSKEFTQNESIYQHGCRVQNPAGQQDPWGVPHSSLPYCEDSEVRVEDAGICPQTLPVSLHDEPHVIFCYRAVCTKLWALGVISGLPPDRPLRPFLICFMCTSCLVQGANQEPGKWGISNASFEPSLSNGTTGHVTPRSVTGCT